MRKMNLIFALIMILTVALAASAQGSTYTVEPGDTLDTIGQELDVSVVSLQLANDIEPGDFIFPGDVLTIPADAAPYGAFPATDTDLTEGGGIGGGAAGEFYVIQPQDTLDVIAQERNVSVVSLIQVNEIENPRLIMPGMTILIPDDAPPYGAFPATDTDLATGGGAGGGVAGEVYIIQPRDTIDQIAADFNAATRCIVDANEITNVRMIQPGQTLVIPDDCPAYVGFAIPSTVRPTGEVNTTTTTPDTSSDTSSDASSGTSPSGAAEGAEGDTDEGDSDSEGEGETEAQG